METNTVTFISEEKLTEIIRNAVNNAVIRALGESKKTTDEQLLSSSEVCKRYNIARGTLAVYQKRRYFKVYKFGGKNYYKKDEIENFILNSRKKYEHSNFD